MSIHNVVVLLTRLLKKKVFIVTFCFWPFMFFGHRCFNLSCFSALLVFWPSLLWDLLVFLRLVFAFHWFPATCSGALLCCCWPLFEPLRAINTAKCPPSVAGHTGGQYSDRKVLHTVPSHTHNRATLGEEDVGVGIGGWGAVG